MTGNFPLDWAILSISLFNTILMFWLGLTILLNAERRTWGLVLSGGALIMGGVFFLSHTAIISFDFNRYTQGLNFWWRVGWIPVTSLPVAWYAVMLWYNGFWSEAGRPIRRRHIIWFWLNLIYALGILLALFLTNSLPSADQLLRFEVGSVPTIGGLPLITILTPLQALLCTTLSLELLIHPAPAERIMGELARQRARPWLIAASFVLLLVSLLVGGVIAVVYTFLHPLSLAARPNLISILGWFDLIIESFIAACLLFVGQAVVSYEVFTGATLPRRGLQNYWRRAILLAIGFGVIASWGLLVSLRPIYNLLIGAMLITAFYALLRWRAFADRQRAIDSLRPFITSQRLYEQLLSDNLHLPGHTDIRLPFQALCADILNAQSAQLIPFGPLAPLAGAALVYPDPDASLESKPAPVLDLVKHFPSSQTLCLLIDPNQYKGARWAVPLWSERGLIGLLLLGDRRDNSLYTQEEIEIARAAGERLIDTQASAEMARRLMSLQRQRLIESQVLDRRTRRLMHDDILPQLHTALLSLSSLPASPTLGEALDSLAEVHRKTSNLLHNLPAATAPDVIRMGLLAALKQVAEKELQDQFDTVTWQIEPEVEASLQTLAPITAEVLYYAAREAMRNAAHHGRGGEQKSTLNLTVSFSCKPSLKIEVMDDGVGINRLPEPADNISSSGQGLALHSTLMAVIGGELLLESIPGEMTRVSLILRESTNSH